jgi:hypothetical protein
MDTIILDNDMFQDDNDINCYNLFIATGQGVEMWDVDIFQHRYPRIYSRIKSNFDRGILSFDVFNLINISLG